MIERPKVVKAPGYINSVPDMDTVRTAAAPMILDDKLFVPATAATTGNESGERDFVLVMLSIGVSGLYMSFTPAGAREFAAAILRGCEMAETQLATKAQAAIDAARKADR